MQETPSQQPTNLPQLTPTLAVGSQPQDRSGQHVGSYQLVRRIASGGFADVYLAEHLHLHTQAAIKLLRTYLAEDDLRHFGKEARIIASLRHPHIISVLDFSASEGIPFLVMEYAPNGTLRQRHPRGTRLPAAQILDYLRQVGAALQHAHDQRLIHCDIKPENMLIGRSNEILLSDFGIAVVAQSTRLQLTQEIIGTLSYMAPEQIQGRPVLASDQYSLAIVAYEWLAGAPPFQGAIAEVLAQQVQSPPRSLLESLPDFSPKLWQVLETALAKSPEQRYPAVRDFIAAFEAALQSEQPLRLPATTQAFLPLANYVAPSPTTSSPNEETQRAIIQPQQAVIQPTAVQPVSRQFSRRALLIGGLSLTAGGLLVGGGWLLTHNGALRSANSPLPTPTRHPASTPTPAPTLGKLLRTYHGHFRPVSAVAWVPPAGTLIASASQDSSAHIWLASDGTTSTSYGGHSNAINAIACRFDGTRVASGSSDNTVQVWDTLTGGNPFTYNSHSDFVTAVAWSPDGTRLASGSVDRTAQTWDSADGQNSFTYSNHTDTVTALAWSHDGSQVASASDDATVQIWNAQDGSNSITYSQHTDRVLAVAWSPDGLHIASAGADKTVQVWEVASQKLSYTYNGHSDIVNAVAWSPNGTRLASAGADKTVQVWDSLTGGNVYTYSGHADAVNSVAWSLDGTRLASASNDTTIQVWRAI